MEFIAASWCTKKWLRLYQTLKNLSSGDLGIQGVHTFIMIKNQDNIKNIKKNFQEISRLSIEIIL